MCAENEALSTLRARFENRPVMEEEEALQLDELPPITGAQRANVWWIKAVHTAMQQHKYYIRFMDAHVLTLSEQPLPFLYIERWPRALYQQIEEVPNGDCLQPEFFFRRVYTEASSNISGV